MSDEVRVANTTLKCPVCNKDIKIGHPYVYRQRQMRGTIRLDRVHPECKEKEYA